MMVEIVKTIPGDLRETFERKEGIENSRFSIVSRKLRVPHTHRICNIRL